MLEEGSVTMLSYGSKITVVFVSLVSTAISVVGFTDIARLKNQNDKKGVFDYNSISILFNCFFK